MDYKAAVEAAAEKIAGEVRGGELKGRRVFILLPPGNSRPAVADALCSRLGNCAVFTYRQGKIDAGAVRRRAEAGVAVVVPRDFSEAADLYKQLKDLRPAAVFLPAIYEKVLKEAGVEAEDWQKADYSFARRAYRVRLWPSGRGVHLSLLGASREEAEKVRALYKEEGRLNRAALALAEGGAEALFDLVKEAVGFLAGSAVPSVVGVLRELARRDEAPFAAAAVFYRLAKGAAPLLDRYEALACEAALRT